MSVVGRHAGQSAGRLKLTTAVVAAYVMNNYVRPREIVTLIGAVHEALDQIGREELITQDDAASEKAQALSTMPTPEQIRRSITPDALISFINGKRYKTLKRHLTERGLTFAAYRALYGLPADYLKTAANYSIRRAAIARTHKFVPRHSRVTKQAPIANRAAGRGRRS